MERSDRATISLYGRDGRRKYLTPAERLRFIAEAWKWTRPEVATLCLMIAFTGCRISEALSLTDASIEFSEGFVAIRSLKKRGAVVVREIPLPMDVLAYLRSVHEADDRPRRLWSWSRGRAWCLVKEVLHAADVRVGPHCTAKGLRHAFGIHAVRSGVPVTLVQRWMGHSRLSTTAIYLDATGNEERELASRMWTAPTTRSQLSTTA